MPQVFCGESLLVMPAEQRAITLFAAALFGCLERLNWRERKYGKKDV